MTTIPATCCLRLTLTGHRDTNLVKHDAMLFVPPPGMVTMVGDGDVALTVEVPVWLEERGMLVVNYATRQLANEQGLREVLGILTARGWVVAE
jgi:hypothetical protein